MATLSQRLNLHHVELFRIVADTGSFSAGARSLGISQPAVSAQIAQLETVVGGVLLERLPRGVRVTEAGQVLHAAATRIARVESTVRQNLRSLQDGNRGRIAVGASTSIGSYLLPIQLASFVRQHPGIEPSIVIANTADIQTQVEDGTLDIGLTEGDADPARFNVRVFQQDELVLITSTSHRFASRVTKVDPRELQSEPILAREPGSGTRVIVERFFAAHDFHLDPVMSINSTEAIKRAVSGGLGIAILSAMAIEDSARRNQLAVVTMKGPPITRALHLITPRDRTSTPAATAFIDLLMKAGG